MEEKLATKVESVESIEQEELQYRERDVEMSNNHIGEKKAKSKWKRFLTLSNVANKIKPLNSFSGSEEKDSHEHDERRKSFLHKFSLPQKISSFAQSSSQTSGYLDDHLNFSSCSRGVVDPECNFYYMWLGVITIVWLYNIWMQIARQAFQELQNDAQVVWFTLDYTSDFIYILDIAVQFRTGYLENGLLVLDSGKLTRNYLCSSSFIVDVLSLLPLDIFFLALQRVQPLLRFPRFLKIYRAKNFYRLAESRTSYPNLIRVLNLGHTLMLLMHWFACFYYMISESEGFFVRPGDDRGWAYPLPMNANATSEWSTLRRKYLHSIYWSCLTLTTIGEKQSPDTDIQYICTLTAYFLGIFAFATVVGQVGNVITNKNVDRLEFERLVDNAKNFMKTKGVSRDMQKRILRWYDYSWSRGIFRGASDVNSLGMIPDTLKVELAIRVNMDTLRKVSIFKLVQPEFLYALVLKMRSFVFTPGDLVCRKGEVAREMFIINHGILNVMNESGNVVASLGAGEFFGEIGVLNIVNGVNKRVANVVSVGYSEVFCLSGKDVLKAMKYYPEAKNLLLIYGRQRLTETQNSDSASSMTTGTYTPSNSASSSNSSVATSKLLQTVKQTEEKSKPGNDKNDNNQRKEENGKRKTTNKKAGGGSTLRNNGCRSNESCALLSISGAVTAVATSIRENEKITPVENVPKESSTEEINHTRDTAEWVSYLHERTIQDNEMNDDISSKISKLNTGLIRCIQLLESRAEVDGGDQPAKEIESKSEESQQIAHCRELEEKDRIISSLEKEIELLKAKKAEEVDDKVA